MKHPLLIIFQLILLQTVFAQEPPPRFKESADEVSSRNAFIKTYQISNTIKGDSILHTNQFFSIRCKHKGTLRNFSGTTWLLTSKTFNVSKEPEIVISGFDKQSYSQNSVRQELEYFGYNKTFDSWNLDKIGEYYFTFSPIKSPVFSSRNLKNARSITKSKLKIDGTKFIKYEFKVNVDGVELIETNYLAVIDNFVFIIHQRKYLTDKEDIIKTFKKKKA